VRAATTIWSLPPEERSRASTVSTSTAGRATPSSSSRAPTRVRPDVGAGAGSYEPEDRYVLAVEPSPTMRAQRPSHLAPAIDAVAEALPFDDRSVDAAMAVLSVHQWPDTEKGLGELRRVARGPVVILTFDPEAIVRFWLADYVPELVELESRRVPSIETIRRALGSHTEVRIVPVPPGKVPR
jgi:SAM-dependent methyltransferase